MPSLPGYRYWAGTGLTGQKEKGCQCHGSVPQMDGRRSGEWCPWIIFGLYPMALSYRNRSGNWNRPQCISLLVDISLLQPCLLFCSSLTYETLAWSGSSPCMSPLCFTFNWASLLSRVFFPQMVPLTVSTAIMNPLKIFCTAPVWKEPVPSSSQVFGFLLKKTHNPTQAQVPAKSPSIAAFPLRPSAPHFTFDCSHAASFYTQMRDCQSLSSLLPHILHPFTRQAVLYSGPHIH